MVGTTTAWGRIFFGFCSARTHTMWETGVKSKRGIHLHLVDPDTPPEGNFIWYFQCCAPVVWQGTVTWRTDVEFSTCGTMLEFKMIVDLSGLWVFWLGMLDLYFVLILTRSHSVTLLVKLHFHTLYKAHLAYSRRNGRCFSGSHVILRVFLLVLDIWISIILQTTKWSISWLLPPLVIKLIKCNIIKHCIDCFLQLFTFCLFKIKGKWNPSGWLQTSANSVAFLSLRLKPSFWDKWDVVLCSFHAHLPTCTISKAESDHRCFCGPGWPAFPPRICLVGLGLVYAPFAVLALSAKHHLPSPNCCPSFGCFLHAAKTSDIVPVRTLPPFAH